MRSIVEKMNEAKYGLTYARQHRNKQEPQEMAIVPQPHAIAEKSAMMVMIAYTYITNTTVTHAGKSPYVTSGTVFHRYTESGIRSIWERHHIEIFVWRLVGAHLVHIVG